MGPVRLALLTFLTFETLILPARVPLTLRVHAHPNELPELADLSGDLRFADERPIADAPLVELAEALANARESRASAPLPEDIASTLRAFISRHAELAPRDLLGQARQEIDNSLAVDMSVAYFADVAGLQPEAFARRFKRSFGTTPARYRLIARLNHAARLAWSRLDLSIDRIAEESGFPDAPYFHRTFRGHFGCTPAAWARRTRVPGLEVGRAA